MNTDVQTAPCNCIAFFYLLHSQQLLREEKKIKIHRDVIMPHMHVEDPEVRLPHLSCLTEDLTVATGYL